MYNPEAIEIKHERKLTSGDCLRKYGSVYSVRKKNPRCSGLGGENHFIIQGCLAFGLNL